MKFIHAADLHVDSPLRGLDNYPGAPVERLRGATRQALIALVDLALEQQVAFVLLAGDIYDGNWADFRTGLFFREQMRRLTRQGIQVYMVKGNHDAESQISRQLPPLAGLHVFSARKAETFELAEQQVALHGRSFPNQAVPEDLLPGYPAARAGWFNIGLLHTSLNGREGHDTYAPTSVEAMLAKGYDYFALGHVHEREVVREAAPRIVYPGNLQGRHARETGAKGCELVTVNGGVIESSVAVELDAVRWHRLHLDVSAMQNLEDLRRHFLTSAQGMTAGASDRLHAVRVHLHGQTVLHQLEARQPGTLAAALQAATQDLESTDLWLEQVRLDLRSPLDRSVAAERTDAIGEVVRLVDTLTQDEQLLRAWIAQQLGEMPALPASLADVYHDRIDSAALAALLADAEATVLAQLSADHSGAGSR